MSNKHVFSTTLAGRPLSVEIGELAKQANGAVLVRYGDTVVLSAAVASKKAGTGDFFPLTVHYIEKMYAVGKVPGGFIKREGRPSEAATLTSRLIDRPLRPMFPEGVRNEIQITNTVLSVDQDCTPEMAAMLGASLALAVSDIPFDGPVAGVNVGRVNGEIVINPTVAQAELSDIELTVAGTATAINMVESSAKEVSEADMLEALLKGHAAIKELVAFQNEIVAQIGKEKFEFTLAEVAPEVAAQVGERYKSRMIQAIQTQEKKAREAAVDAVMEEATEFFAAVYADRDDYDQLMKDVSTALHDLEKDEVRRLITKERVRPDGRRIDEIRPLSSSVALLPRVHGSGLFTRGQTQVLTAATLAPLGEHQVIDGLGIEEGKRFIHHYNFPNFSVGETGRVGSPGRREIGHGALGERALKQVIPAPEDFPYTIRLVSEVLESNGSSSQASICAGTLALMDAGVPIKAPVAGIAMGLVMEGEDYTVLTDIQGLEDHLGDMDFKVAGTAAGITALQMDIKIQGITEAILTEALTQAKKARLEILDELVSTLPEARKELSPYAPKIDIIQINPDKIKVVIGRGGETINGIIDATGVKIDIDQTGNVSIASSDQDMINKARQMIEDLVREVEVGQVYTGKVKRIEKFGAFVEVLPGKDGLVHISELEHRRVAQVEDVLKIGDVVEVKVIEIDNQGRINLSRKVLLPKD
ncbi:MULTISPECIES: polyribonucleotide nucleotidyltransferase [Abiotrophia]|jgi:polyribonucleotide nucleotidyltransferase|uniref:Polyribonucleotide nucleotidyltransferase n=3 Tax=Abiotrophia defectiva TaxID=46125 RepID=W1Q5N5_ABIDE|nr:MULTISPECIES: polyribonucleotide nucleotidyltransferase [Abiotrophia]RKW17441.1 MAG: polyribonucleotide nucleotidyltransferase [Catonella sp.]ESK66532.1 polyribonucleotide nucleotidyltransferase [Abiotrophia defectiva ATCC 49176]MBF0935921.1 polyribonucleotide nucleotidyltransferase [Abiotrophia sp.]MCY7225034.1 polyribonucleotide nucleotidyltransferase [Abiotrophia defectiva]OFS30011.1 polyribonucleotide nucleotidyltransferase [Abiotrophia sp. HMSC24B09]